MTLITVLGNFCFLALALLRLGDVGIGGEILVLAFQLIFGIGLAGNKDSRQTGQGLLLGLGLFLLIGGVTCSILFSNINIR
ncbi:hypothetical protein [Foetidibacter luteolus]|uniref:hypothetical protein n=1 Tax=Foetidibacter luteolus TaxID=2608880 RepID=UPI00129C0EDB|nr:hypothetical protein [Foetidibacter luteolus]